VAAVDIGTNSVRLLITDASGRELAREMQITRLGQGVDVSGALQPEAIARTVAVLDQYRALLEQHSVTRVRGPSYSLATKRPRYRFAAQRTASIARSRRFWSSTSEEVPRSSCSAAISPRR
jgi:exopolyphosphatase/guanosine-5'-triphosphate,3'-diphosphate pyrophosphatase